MYLESFYQLNILLSIYFFKLKTLKRNSKKIELEYFFRNADKHYITCAVLLRKSFLLPAKAFLTCSATDKALVESKISL